MLDALPYWTIVVTTLLVGGFIALVRRHKPLQAPFPPGPKPWPFIGNIFDTMALEPWLLYMNWEDVYQSKILSLTLPGKRIVILNSVEDTVELLEKRAGMYSDRARVPLIELAGWTFNVGLMQKSERWRDERRFFQQTFKRESVTRFLPIQTTKIYAMLRQLLTDPESFSDHYKTLSAAIILEIAYGYDAQPKNDHIVETVERAITHLIDNGTNPSVAALNVFPILRYLPRWVPGTSFHKVVDDCREFTKDMLNIPFEYVRKSMHDGNTKPSLVRSFLESNVLGEESMKGIGGTAFSAGTDAVVSVLECFFFAMSLFPEKQRKAQEEIDRVIGSDRLPTFGDQDSLPYIDAIFRETLRWLPPSPLTIPHVAEEDDIYKGYFIPKGSIVYPNVWAMSHDRTKFKDPEAFIPERFLDENGKLKENSRALAFGFGRRLCPGRYLAINTAWLSIAAVLASFNIGLPYDEAGNLIKLQQVYIKADVLHLKPYKCIITPRSDNARKLVEATEDTAGY